MGKANKTSNICSESRPETVSLLAAIFWGPDRLGCPDILVEELPLVLECARREHAPFLAEVEGLAACLPDNAAEFETFCETVGSEYVRLFVSSLGGVPAPPYQSCFEGDRPEVMGPAALAMKDRFAAAGLELDDSCQELPDHLAAELEFLHFLLSGEEGGEASAFARDVMLPWVEAFCGRLAEAEPHPFFAAASRLLLAVLKSLS